MCNLYNVIKGPQAIREAAGAMRDVMGDWPPPPGVFPDYPAPIVRNPPLGVREPAMARWGHAGATVRSQGPQLRSWRHERQKLAMAIGFRTSGRLTSDR